MVSPASSRLSRGRAIRRRGGNNPRGFGIGISPSKHGTCCDHGGVYSLINVARRIVRGRRGARMRRVVHRAKGTLGIGEKSSSRGRFGTRGWDFQV